METPTVNIIEYLRANGLTVRDTGAIRSNDQRDVVFVHERANGQVVLSHPPSGGRAQTARRTVKNRERALEALRSFVTRRIY